MAALLAVVCAAPWAEAMAQTVVTACGRDDATGGQNLRDALVVGGRITFRCGGGPATIQITTTHALNVPVTIEGEGRITLVGDGTRPLFSTATRLELAGLEVRNEAPVPTSVSGIVHSASADVVLNNVRTLKTLRPYVTRSLVANNSLFEGNGRADGLGAEVVVDAERIELRNVQFVRNFDHPLGGGVALSAGRAPQSREILIEDSAFTENRRSLLVLDATLTVRRSRFVNNGLRLAQAGREWDCCGGAITLVQSKAEIVDSEFTGNGSGGFGGAIYALASQLRLARTLFAGNSARIGGALAFLGRPAKVNVWSSGDSVAPSLQLQRVRFKQNTAELAGGALSWAGAAAGDAVLFAQNHAARGGAIAHWSVRTGLPQEYAGIFPEITAQTQNTGESFELSRGAFLENQARAEGAAIHASDAPFKLGNALVVRNVVTAPTEGNGAAVQGAELSLTNTTVAQNQGGGVKLDGAARRLVLANTIVAGNAAYGCSAPPDKLDARPANLQYPVQDCGTSIPVRDAQLDGEYAPSLTSPARNGGDLSGCMSDLLVAGIDLHGRSRGNRGACAIGAVEPDQKDDPVTGWSPDGSEGPGFTRLVFWLLLIILLLGFFFGFWWVRRCRRRKKKRASEDKPVDVSAA